MKQANDFLELHKQGMDALGFWTDEYRSTILKSIEGRYKTEIIRYWYVSDFVVNGDKVLVKWVKRFEPLTDKDLSENYGR